MLKYRVGLAGPAGVGKDTVGSLMTTYRVYAFAGPLKQALATLSIYEPPSRHAKELNLDGRNYSYRKAAQTLGTEWARKLDKNFWVKLAQTKTALASKVVFTDVRFEEEASWIRGQGGVIWHISGRSTTVFGEAADHESERQIQFKDGDKRIDNSGSIQDLACVVQKLVAELENGR